MLLPATILTLVSALNALDNGSWWRDLHHSMSIPQLAFYFDVNSVEKVDPLSFEVTTVIHTKQTFDVTKRNGERNLRKSITIKAFGKTFDLSGLDSIQHSLLSPQAAILAKEANNVTRIIRVSERLRRCRHYRFNRGSIAGGLSSCADGKYKGFLMDGDDLYDISPLEETFHEKQRSKSHLVRKVSLVHVLEQIGMTSPAGQERFNPKFGLFDKRSSQFEKRASKKSKNGLNVEIFLVVDWAACKSYLDYYEGDEEKLIELVLVIMNDIQALYHYPSLGRTVDFTIVRLELQNSAQFDDARGERNELLTSFCKYQGGDVYIEGDDDPGHWDIALLMSGVDFWAYKSGNSGSKSHSTMGLSTVTGVCDRNNGCVIGEVGVENQDGQPYPSCGFTVAFVLAHEIGHNLGFHHDSSDVYNQPMWFDCDRNGYIMSPTRNSFGEVTWSKCSREFLSQLDMPCLEDKPKGKINRNVNHNVLGNVPGNFWNTDMQCQFLLKDDEAFAKTQSGSKMCSETLECSSKNRFGVFRAGPVLEGTKCGKGNLHCISGECEEVDIEDIAYLPEERPEWSEWKEGSCKYNCIKGSTGYSIHRRRCLHGKCKGPRRKVVLCDDFTTRGCDKDYKDNKDYASKRCRVFKKKNERVERIVGEGKVVGGQSEYNEKAGNRWACTIGCQALTGGLYHPVAELGNNKKLSPYFPDGTWCHVDDDGVDYFCRNSHCLSEKKRRGARSGSDPQIELDQMAPPEEDRVKIPQEVKDYFMGKAPPPSGKNFKSNDFEFELD